MSQQHTPEPWEASALGCGLQANNVPICQFFDECDDDYPNHEANARRIVAAVNACAGIPTELLEDSKCWAEAGIETATSLRKQRDELMEALCWVMWNNQGGMSNTGRVIRKVLGLGQNDRMTDEQVSKAHAFYASVKEKA